MLMIKESCKLTRHEYILLNIYCMGKRHLDFLRIQLTFHSESFLMWPYHHQANQSHPLKNLGESVQAQLHSTNSSSHYIDCFLPDIIIIKESTNLIGQEHILVNNLKLCALNCCKNFCSLRN